MISIVTAVHNQLAINKLFYKSLVRYTNNPFELIIIDNNSIDGSREFFHSVGATVIENDGNYSYPYCQNQGIDIAKYNFLAFMNNDIIPPPNWDQKFIDTMKHNDLDVVTCCGIERVEDQAVTKKIKRRWKMIKNLLIKLPFSGKYELMHKLMYGDWVKYSNLRYQKHKLEAMLGFVGNTVVMTRRGIEKIGRWDEQIQGADFDLCMRSVRRSEEYGDVKPIHIAMDIFIHHFIRITSKSRPPAFVDADNMISFEKKWGGKRVPKGFE
jgi:GT2 family glycosyltransferase